MGLHVHGILVPPQHEAALGRSSFLRCAIFFPLIPWFFSTARHCISTSAGLGKVIDRHAPMQLRQVVARWCAPHHRAPMGAALGCSCEECMPCSKLVVFIKVRRVVFRQYLHDSMEWFLSALLRRVLLWDRASPTWQMAHSAWCKKEWHKVVWLMGI